ncbi:SEC-C metal-binding domain-containing protein [Paenibacillus sp. GCM10027627]|uniref:SEC-C metal-binding domain-containing protein n=1 Tax=unclassified Paenibacillus TaxID=185978 RepID=UPI00362B9B1B
MQAGHQDLTEQMDLKHAIKNEVCTKLEDILSLLNKTELSELASTYSLRGRSKMNKAQLASALAEIIIEPQQLESGSELLSDEERKTLLRFSENIDQAALEAFPFASFSYARSRGWLFCFNDKGKPYFVMSDEVRGAFREMSGEQTSNKSPGQSLVLDYVVACVNLYGVIPTKELYAILNKQNPGVLSETEFIEIVEHLPQLDWHIKLQYNRFYDETLESLDEIEALENKAKGKPYYAPPKAELMQYKDSWYTDSTSQLVALKTYILNHLSSDANLARMLIEDIQMISSMEGSLQHILQAFENRNIEFRYKEQVEAIVPLIIDVVNHTRVWSNKGHTPLELKEMNPEAQDAKQAPYRLRVNQQITSVKVGRNEPCICGSGKKYKKCCGAAV